jgi:UDP-2-acetamido-3-amino-2,3-dideoxy-glucuronate N-acetyltransferase
MIGHIGLGYWGKNILRNLDALGALVVAADLSQDIVRARQAEYPHIRFTTDIDSVIHDPSIRAVVLSTPASTHAALAASALDAGKDVFVEKPLALTVEEGERLVQLAKKRGRILMVGHLLHYHGAVTALKQLVHSGRLGEIRYLYSNRLNIGKLRREEDILWSFAPHDISLMLSLLDDEPTAVTAFGGAYVTKRVHDTTVTTLTFSNGVRGHIFVSWLNPFKEQRFVVVGSDAMVVFDDTASGSEKLSIYRHKVMIQENGAPRAIKANREAVAYSETEPLRVELQHFIECVQSRATPKTDGEEGMRVLRVLRAAARDLDGAHGAPAQTTLQEKESFFVHDTAIIDDNTEIGAGSKIWHFSHILSRTTIGERCIVGQNVMIGPDVVVGNGCKIQNNVSLYKGVTLEDDVFCAPSSVFTNVYTPRAFIERKDEFLPTLVKRGATIGANATIICGVTIGRYALIGAGSVVTRDVPDFALMVGVPAKQKGWVCVCGVPLHNRENHESSTCTRCQREYKFMHEEIIPVVNDV